MPICPECGLQFEQDAASAGATEGTLICPSCGAETPHAEGPDPLAETAELVSAESVEEDASVEDAEKAESIEKKKKDGMLARLAETNPYTVMLGISLVAILVAIFCLYMEWSSYEFDTWAKSIAT